MSAVILSYGRLSAALLALFGCLSCTSKSTDAPPISVVLSSSAPAEIPAGSSRPIKKSKDAKPYIELIGSDVWGYFAVAIADLGKEKVLSLVAVPVENGDTIATIVTRAYKNDAIKVVGDFYLYLCELNANACRIRPCANLTSKCRVRSQTADWRRLAFAPANATPPKHACNDPHRAPYIVCVPDLTVMEHPRGATVVRQVGVKDDISKIVLDNTAGCTNWDNGCARLVVSSNNLNATIMRRLNILPGEFPPPEMKLNEGDWWLNLTGPIRLPARQIVIAPHFMPLVTNSWALTHDAVVESTHKVMLGNRHKAKAYLNVSSVSHNLQVSPDALTPNAAIADTNDTAKPGAANTVPNVVSNAAPPSSFSLSKPLDSFFNGDARKAMNFTHQDELLTQLKSVDGQAAQYSADIGIWDDFWDESHCELIRGAGPAKRKDVGAPLPSEPHGLENSVIGDSDPADDPPQTVESNVCFAVPASDDIDTYIDHATFIAGLLAGQPDKVGMIGIDPQASLWMFQINNTRLSNGEDPISNVQVMPGIHDFIFPRPFVINVSQGTTDDAAVLALKHMLRNDAAAADDTGTSAWTREILFVMSARDDGISYTKPQSAGGFVQLSDDQVLRRGLLTVAGLGVDGQDVVRCSDLQQVIDKFHGTGVPLATGQNRPSPKCTASKTAYLSDHGEAFDVAAVGISVGPVSRGRFGILAGASVAAPYVSGLAALTRARLQLAQRVARTNHPANFGEWIKLDDKVVDLIRERILFTADALRDTSDGPIVKFGRVNFDRALDFDFDELSASGASSATIKSCVNQSGRYVLSAASPDDRYFVPPYDGVSAGVIRRITREGPLTGQGTSDTGYRLVYINAGGTLDVGKHAHFAHNTKLHFNCEDKDTRTSLDSGHNVHLDMDATDLDDLSRCSFYRKDCEALPQPQL